MKPKLVDLTTYRTIVCILIVLCIVVIGNGTMVRSEVADKQEIVFPPLTNSLDIGDSRELFLSNSRRPTLDDIANVDDNVKTFGVIRGIRVGGISIDSIPESKPHLKQMFSLLRSSVKPIILWICRGSGCYFSDHVKYSYLECVRNPSPHFDCVFATTTHVSETYNEYLHSKLPGVVFIQLFNDYFLLSRVRAVIRDTALGIDLVQESSFLQAVYRLPQVNLWHGMHIKMGGLSVFHRSNYNLASDIAIGYVGVHSMVSWSPFVTKVYKTIMHASKYPELGSIRNDVFSRHTFDDFDLINVDMECLNIVQAAKQQGIRVIGYFPTSRYRSITGVNENAFSVGILEIDSLNRYAMEHNLLFIIKMHYYDEFSGNHINLKNYPRVISMNLSSDAHLLFRKLDIMITDYSGIFYDFLLYNRPCIFLTWNHERYIQYDWLYIDYQQYVPGPVFTDQVSLLTYISNVLDHPESDIYVDKRRTMATAVFGSKGMDGNAGQRFIKYLESEFVKNEDNCEDRQVGGWGCPLDFKIISKYAALGGDVAPSGE